jgi:hypothetical protein
MYALAILGGEREEGSAKSKGGQEDWDFQIKLVPSSCCRSPSDYIPYW